MKICVRLSFSRCNHKTLPKSIKSVISESSDEILGAVRQVNSWSARRRFSNKKISGQGINVKLWAMHLEALEFVCTEKPQDFINVFLIVILGSAAKKIQFHSFLRLSIG